MPRVRGVNHTAKRSASRWIGGFSRRAWSTSRTICWYWLCAAGRRARTCNTPSRLTLPDGSSVPDVARTGSGSPVSADSSTAEVPPVTSVNRKIRSEAAGAPSNRAANPAASPAAARRAIGARCRRRRIQRPSSVPRLHVGDALDERGAPGGFHRRRALGVELAHRLDERVDEERIELGLDVQIAATVPLGHSREHARLRAGLAGEAEQQADRVLQQLDLLLEIRLGEQRLGRRTDGEKISVERLQEITLGRAALEAGAGEGGRFAADAAAALSHGAPPRPARGARTRSAPPSR